MPVLIVVAAGVVVPGNVANMAAAEEVGPAVIGSGSIVRDAGIRLLPTPEIDTVTKPVGALWETYVLVLLDGDILEETSELDIADVEVDMRLDRMGRSDTAFDCPLERGILGSKGIADGAVMNRGPLDAETALDALPLARFPPPVG